MNTAAGLKPEDRGDFELVAHQALNTPGIRTTLSRVGTSASAGELYTHALQGAATIAAAAGTEHAYLQHPRASAQARQRPSRPQPRSRLPAALGPVVKVILHCGSWLGDTSP
ncbi:hypothetical protein BSL84_29855 [Streptomyces sp. TN58]|nr:hypothetical protein BSL84_29855 [Streptomyces sp. TN58]